MLKVFKKRLVLEILGILLLSLLIWYAGPYLAFADHRPLATEGARYLIIALVIAIWAALKLLKILKAASAGR